MKHTLIAAAAAAAMALAGCSDRNEAKRFGYKGSDLAEEEPLFFTVAPGVTNYVPSRVLVVNERYEFTPDELALIAEAGTVTPGAPLKEIPEGYEKKDEGPWFVYLEKDPRESFGFKGRVGVLAHFDEDKNEWSTGQAYFSVAWDKREDAVAGLGRLKAEVVERFHPKKVYEFADSWVAEYVRLRVMAVVGQKADGKWGLMLDFGDKNCEGCGTWEPLENQQERLDVYRYAKALKEWKRRLPEIVAENHAAVEKARAGRGLAALSDGEWAQLGDGRNMFQSFGTFDFDVPAEEFTNAMNRVWAERVAAAEKATGAKFPETRSAEEVPGGVVAFAACANELYQTVRLDVAFPCRPQIVEPKEEGAQEPPPPLRGQYRVILVEATQPGFEIPPRPQPPKKK